MKVTHPSQAPPPPSNITKPGHKRDEQADAQSASVTRRDFASVLDEMARPRPTQSRDDNDQDSNDFESKESKPSERAEREREARRREDREQESGGGFEQRSGVRELAPRGEAVGARAILHIADLERIVAAVRTQINAEGRKQLTMQLQRSVLEGLRVKLSADETGRVTVEFIAASERIKTQLDARSTELAELLRSRGVNLAALKTSLNEDASNQTATGDRQQGYTLETADTLELRPVSPLSEAKDTKDTADASVLDDVEMNKSYRA